MAKRMNFYTVKLVKERGHLYDVEDMQIRSCHDGYRLGNMLGELDEQTKEHFGMMSLDIKNKVLGYHTIHVGSINASIVSPRDVFQQALLNNAASIIVLHNHPSGNPEPSPQDIDVTNRLARAGNLLGIELLDHIIVGHNGKYLSLREKGYIA